MKIDGKHDDDYDDDDDDHDHNQWRLVEFFTGGESFEELGVVRDSCGSHTQKWY